MNALGHAHPRIVKTIRAQAGKLIHVSNLYYHEYQGLLAEKLCSLSELNRAFFSNSGTEAIEGSIKLARLAGHRAGGDAKCRLVALEGSYHGRTFGALSLTGQDKHRKGFEPLLEEVTFVARKPIAAGLPLGAFLAKEEFATAISPGQHGTTFGGGPLACHVALEFLAVVEEQKLLENVNKVGAYLQQELKALRWSLTRSAESAGGKAGRGQGGSRTRLHPGN